MEQKIAYDRAKVEECMRKVNFSLLLHIYNQSACILLFTVGKKHCKATSDAKHKYQSHLTDTLMFEFYNKTCSSAVFPDSHPQTVPLREQ